MGREVHCSFPAVSVHPAKLVWGLARWLLAHVKAEGWVSSGGMVLDPLAGSKVIGLAWNMCLSVLPFAFPWWDRCVRHSPGADTFGRATRAAHVKGAERERSHAQPHAATEERVRRAWRVPTP